VESIDHLSDIALGLAPFQPERLRAFDIRFGIRLPYVGAVFEDIEDLRIEPPNISSCVVAIRGPALSTAAVFDAEMFLGLPIETGGAWLLVRHADFALRFGSGSVTFSSTGDFDTTLRPLSAWLPLARALAYLASGGGVITLTPASTPDARFTLPATSKLDGPYLEQLPEWVRILVGWERMLNLAGTRASKPFSLQDLWAARGAQLAVELFGACRHALGWNSIATPSAIPTLQWTQSTSTPRRWQARRSAMA
jgi:hypothetical protein